MMDQQEQMEFFTKGFSDALMEITTQYEAKTGTTKFDSDAAAAALLYMLTLLAKCHSNPEQEMSRWMKVHEASFQMYMLLDDV